MGRTIKEALQRSVSKRNKSYRYSFDMLGEAALTRADAQRYFEAYYSAIGEIGAAPRTAGDDIFSAPSISVKLSALHPRYEYMQVDRVLRELTPRVLELTEHAKRSGIAMTIDAEEADRLELSLQIFERVFRDAGLAGYDGLGLAVQTYQRRASGVFSYLASLARDAGRRIPVRLVKGAYWDTEIKHAQELGLESYPVFTRKVHTDVSYLACARKALEAGEALYPQFATHNAHTLASVMHYAGSRLDYEFQRLHGMGEELYAEVIDAEKFGRPCRVYAPVGSHKDLLPYLVRRLLENGANTSFVNRIIDESIDVTEIVADPISATEEHHGGPHPRIPSPGKLFGDERRNSEGLNLADDRVLANLLTAMQDASARPMAAYPIVGGNAVSGAAVDSINPADRSHTVGTCQVATVEHVDNAIANACVAQREWDCTPASERAEILEKAADLYEQHRPELLSLCIGEAGKTLPDAVAELREAVDFLRFYAAEARKHFGDPTLLPGPTGERNTLGLRGRGVFVCISPWNFPLAIFTGQVAAALAAGNAVIAKPAEQTPLVAFQAVELLMEAGVPRDVLQFLPGDGAPIGALIAETGGQNAMFVDSSALPEQVVKDAVFSAFNSAGQRCSALRLLCLQKDIADRVIELLIGHMEELVVGNPALLATDVGPAIDEEARSMLEAHVKQMEQTARILYRCNLGNDTESGTFFPPTLIEIDSVDALKREVFGPVLHVMRFRSRDLHATIDAVNATGYGLTMGLHSRIDARARKLAEQSGAGNIYVNRNMIGAVVGVQPFGGRGLSGTGPKAGGPHYLPRFGTEYTVSNNIAAVGGNASLLSLESD
jgi:RHH-type proline utilization regulon transcriptional repressor/proline dehydrogenase/delta 1-pyrroline-5-carboxylate dehydrogenase